MDKALEDLARKEALINALRVQALFASANGMIRQANVLYERADRLQSELEAEFEALLSL